MAAHLDELWDFEDPAGSEARMRAEADRTPDAELRLVLLTQVARALGLQERYSEAQTVLDEVAATPHAASSAELQTRVQLERGRVLRSAGDTAEAALRFDGAARSAAGGGLDALLVDALHMLALLTEAPEGQVRATEEALNVARSSADPAARRWEASLLNNLGMARVELADLSGALATFEEALGVREREGTRRQQQIARWMVGWTLRLLGRREDALVVQRRLLRELEADGTSDEYVHEELRLLGEAGVLPEGSTHHP